MNAIVVITHRPTTSSTSSADASSMTEASFKIQTPSNIPCIIQTALVTAAYDRNRSRARAFLDPGSSTALVTSRLASSLQAKRTPAVTKLEGFVGVYVSQSTVELTLFSIANPNTSGLQIRARVVDQIISDSPAHDISSLLSQPFLCDKEFADPDIGKPHVLIFC